MLSRFTSLALVIAFANQAQAQGVDAKKLRELIRMPKVSAVFGLGFNTQRGFLLDNESVDNSAEIAALEKSLRGDAEDAQRYYRLSDLYDDDDKCKQACARAAALFRQQLRKDPRNARVTMMLGQVLIDRDDEAEAEKLLRQAVELAPGDAECWQALADFLIMKSFRALGGGKKAALQLQLVVAIVTRSLPAENIAAGRKIATEAGVCLDRAIAAAPRQSKAHVYRAVVRTVNILLERAQMMPTNEGDFTETVLSLVQKIAEAKVLDDFKKAAELEPANPRAQAVLGAAEVASQFGDMLFKMKNGDAAAKEKAQEEFLIKTMRIIDDTLARLHALTNHKESRIASEACYLEAMTTIFKEMLTSQDKPNREAWARGEQLLRRAVALQPGNQLAWDWLCYSLVQQEQFAKLAAVCEERLRLKDNARNRYWAAKAHVTLNDYDTAEKHLRAGLRVDANSTLNHVGLAAVLLRRGDAAALA